ncbi:hypothetical protein L917_19993 [Phytophthora nicotianae]|uniref:Uncharacterized protein n=1 Tax=Phytophthora nicotianae TaxID=4792 RepID=W2K466_PHYNI|nr:hypothetical protein L917_19993 [Phytophthora nicotianae]
MVLPIRNVKSLQDMENQVGVGFADRSQPVLMSYITQV